MGCSRGAHVSLSISINTHTHTHSLFLSLSLSLTHSLTHTHMRYLLFFCNHNTETTCITRKTKDMKYLRQLCKQYCIDRKEMTFSLSHRSVYNIEEVEDVIKPLKHNGARLMLAC
jgi:hypothetical protein